MIDIKLRNVKVEDAKAAIECIDCFMRFYSDRRGIYHGVSYGHKFYVYRTDKTVICVGDYGR